MRALLVKVRSGFYLVLVLLALLGLFGCAPPDLECEPAAFYGPPPCEDNQDCVDMHGAGWYCDLGNTFNDGCGDQVSWPLCRAMECEPAAFYGPQPCQDNDECETQYGVGWYCDQDNAYDDGCGNTYTWPVCREATCEPAAYYGPPPCETDAECIAENGAGWYCDTANTYEDDCGNSYTWPVCKEECLPAAYYGPPPCEDNSDCVDMYGAGWFCDELNTFDDGCGNQVAWPVCRETECEPAAYYGPPPCDDNTDCESYGANWYCDTTNTFTDNCGNSYTWPVCKESP
ncbi:MAG: hypothetical protein RBU30_25825 [Polyangia bacterium]|jgi:hypothetical protein|nr:hypothetical protein [Polyangia bacterium]